MNNILITSAGRRVSLIRAFQIEMKKLLPRSKIFAADMYPELSSACMVADEFFTVPSVLASDYYDALITFCLSRDIRLIIPTIDTELYFLAEKQIEFIQAGIIPVISDSNMVSICRNKRKTHSFFDSVGLIRCREIVKDNLVFPVFVKPIDGSSSIGAKKLSDENDLKTTMEANQQYILLEYLDPNDHTEYTVDLYFDRNSLLKCAVPRERIEVRAGEVSKSVTRKDDLYEFILEKFSNIPGFRGCITLQLFRNRHTNSIICIEINPRFGGGYPLSYFAGANYPEMIIREYILNQPLNFNDKWKRDLLMLRYDAEILIDGYKS